MRRISGLTLIELVVTMFISLIVAGALFKVFVDNSAGQAFVQGQNEAETEARQPLDTLIDHLRNAQAVKSVDYAVLKSGTSDSVEYYTANSETEVVKYYLSGTDLKRKVGTDVATTVMTNVEELEFKYFISSESPAQYYTDTVATKYTYVAAEELSIVTEIEIRVVANVDGYTRELTGTVRLRNSPYKKRL